MLHLHEYCLQLFADGQPMHFTPLFLALTMYAIAEPIITASTNITIIFFINTPYFLSETSIFNLLSAFLINPTTIATIASTATRPGTNPVPTVPSVINVPIW